jgi:hypothetical protein
MRIADSGVINGDTGHFSSGDESYKDLNHIQD